MTTHIAQKCKPWAHDMRVVEFSRTADQKTTTKVCSKCGHVKIITKRIRRI